ncbi:MAG: phospholipase D-like domain-containing protein [Bacteroidota bacterium]|jgi:phosphatidylserine/phosphatidylglycerophosphate/cardiolipin synthase-like enzyme|nr:phospholipase D-like domain-containing protein [Bacteroidota bacterium]
MRAIVPIFLAILCTVTVRAQWADHVVISEFATRGAAGNASGEFVELYNPTNQTVNVSGWKFEYRSASGTSYNPLVTIPEGTVMPPKSYYLLVSSTWAATPTGDVSWSASGLADNGNIRISTAAGVPVDRVGFGTGNDPEGSTAPHHGTTANDNSVERKASATSTAASMGAGGPEEFSGNGWDSNNNAADFVVRTGGRQPQNSASGTEPLSADGSGSATVPERTYKAGEAFDLAITFAPDPLFPITAMNIVIPPVFVWSGSTDDVEVDGRLQTELSVIGDTLRLAPLAFAESAATITVKGLTAPASTGNYVVPILTRGAQYFLPIQSSPTVAVRGGPIPIAEARENNASGVPVKLGQLVTVNGIVTVSNQFGSPAYIQDHTGGIAVYDFDFSDSVRIGDEVTITGTLTHFNGLTELEQVRIDTIASSGNEVVPVHVGIDAILNDGVGGNEAYESMLVRINGVTVNTTAWTVTGSGTNYKLSDGSAQLDVRVDNDVPYAGQPAPGGSFDIIGVVSQYKTAAPFAGGYQLMPRLAADIIATGPRIVSMPVECDIAADRIDLCWNTAVEADARVRYGIGEHFELGTAEGGDAGTEQRVTLASLDAGTIYRVQAFSVAGGDTSFAQPMYVCTASATSTGVMNVFFSRAVDNTLYPPLPAQGNVALANKLMNRIDAARHSIDLCLYSLSGQVGDDIAERLLAAKTRGVRIRAIFETDNSNTNAIRTLRSNVPAIVDNFDRVNAGAGLQHNKFVIIDARDRSSDTDDWVITGSWNPTDPGTNDDAQNVIEIQDQALAVTYTREFEEMWGSGTETANSSATRFGARKLDNTPHRFVIGGVPVEAYFSPSDMTTNAIANAARGARTSIYFATLTFTRDDLGRIMTDQHAAGVTVRGLLDNNSDQGNEYDFLRTGGVDVLLKKGFTGLLHHKYMIVDADDATAGAAPLVVTGSHNWSNAAEFSNNENTLVVHSHAIAVQYLQEWFKRYVEAGGTGAIVLAADVPPSANAFALAAFPSPLRAGTALTLRVDGAPAGPLEIAMYDMLGRRVRMHALDATGGRQLVLLPTAGLRPGSYIVTASDAHGHRTQRRIIVW